MKSLMLVATLVLAQTVLANPAAKTAPAAAKPMASTPLDACKAELGATAVQADLDKCVAAKSASAPASAPAKKGM